MRKYLGKNGQIIVYLPWKSGQNHLSSYLHADVYQERTEAAYQIFH